MKFETICFFFVDEQYCKTTRYEKLLITVQYVYSVIGSIDGLHMMLGNLPVNLQGEFRVEFQPVALTDNR